MTTACVVCGAGSLYLEHLKRGPILFIFCNKCGRTGRLDQPPSTWVETNHTPVTPIKAKA